MKDAFCSMTGANSSMAPNQLQQVQSLQQSVTSLLLHETAKYSKLIILRVPKSSMVGRDGTICFVYCYVSFRYDFVISLLVPSKWGTSFFSYMIWIVFVIHFELKTRHRSMDLAIVEIHPAYRW